MTAIAIDDESPALDIIRSYVSKVPFIKLPATFRNAFDALIYMQHQQIDLIFLDVKMPDINGIDFLHSLRHPPMVIFTTAYMEHAVKGFELDAIDYLLKPFSFPRFLKSCNKANELLQSKTRTESESAHIFIKDSAEYIKVMLDEILFIEAAGNYTRIQLDQNKLLSTRIPISEMQAMLPSDKFVRIHRTFIIALQKVNRFDKNQLTIQKFTIPISSKHADLLQQLISSNK